MSEIPELAQRVLAVLISTPQAVSGRRAAELAGTSPTATNKALAALQDQGAVTSQTKGNARLWSATALAGDLLGITVKRDALIMTALPLEYAAFRERITDPLDKRAPSGARYCEGRIIGRDITWNVRLFETSMGNATAASALARALQDLPSDLVVFCGVAGGLRPKEQKFGDVVIADRVYLGSAGKSASDKAGNADFKARPLSVSTSLPLVEIARSIRRNHGTLPPTFRVDVADLVSMDAVQTNAEFVRRMEKELNNVRAVDMESFGHHEAARHLNVPAISVRGISDFVTNKEPVRDARWQPLAAGNAAAVAVEMLWRAHPDDLPPRRKTYLPATDQPGSDTSRPLPPSTQRWIEELSHTSSAAATRARTDLSNAAKSPKTLASNLVTHPPAWVREDVTGAAWASVASLGDAVGSRTARTAWERARHTAAASGDAVAAVIFAVTQARSMPMSDLDNPDSMDRIRAELNAIDLAGAEALEPLIALWVRLSGDDGYRVDEAAVAAAATAVAALGGVELLHRLAPGIPPAPPVIPVTRTATEATGQALLGVLVSFALYLLFREDSRGRVWADAARVLAPWSSEAQLRHLQAELQALHASRKAGAADSITRALAGIETRALGIRSERADWGGPTAEALALAGRARLENDDPEGALRILTTAPNGTATLDEARNPEVAQFAAMAALQLGRVELAAELAEQTGSPVERHLLRAAIFSQSRNTHELAREEYRQALHLAKNDSFRSHRALGGLARLGYNLDRDAEASSRLQELATVDPEAADLIRASQALIAGNPKQSLAFAKRYASLAAVEAQSDALSALGRADDAIDVLDQYGQRTGDLGVRMEAMELAARSSRWVRADALASDIVGTASPGPLRDAARRARADIAARAGRWGDVEAQLLLVISERATVEETQTAADPNEGVRNPYVWQIAEARYHQKKYREALNGLSDEFQKSTSDPHKVRLVLALLHRLLHEQPDLIDDRVIDWVLAVGSSMVDQEDIAASVIGLLLGLPRWLPSGIRARAGQMFDAYFGTHGDSGSIRQIDLSPQSGNPEDEPNIEPLLDELRNSAAPPKDLLVQVTQMVLAGRVPLGFLAVATHRSYAEALVTQMLDQYVARPMTEPDKPWLDPARVDAARAAVDEGTVVVDTSALVISSLIADRRDLIASLDNVLIPRSLQEDIYIAHRRLSLRSPASMGWNELTGRAVLTEYDPEDVERWAVASLALVETLQQLRPVDDAYLREEDPKGIRSDTPQQSLPVTAEETARQLGATLWADDAALLRLAEAEHVPAFGTPELIEALRTQPSTPLRLPSHLQLMDLLRRHRVVDLPPLGNWLLAARADQWTPRSQVRLALSRPNAWRDVPASFSQYQKLIRGLQARRGAAASESDGREGGLSHAATIALWCEAAALGLGRAVATPARQTLISTLIAWTALNTEPLLDAAEILRTYTGVPGAGAAEPGTATVLEELLMVAQRLQRELFPAGDGVRNVVTVLSDTLRSTADGATAAAVLARAMSSMTDEGLRREAFAALWKSPKPLR